MSDAIRDVTIRVRIQQVETQLKPPDFSAWLQGLAQVKAEALDVGRQVQTMITPPATFAEQAAGFRSVADQVNAVGISAEKVAAVDPFANLDSSVARLNSGLEQQAGALNTVEQAATRNFDALLNQARAETALEQATVRATASQRGQSVEMINGAGNALRAAASSNTLSGTVANLGQAFIFTLRETSRFSEGNAGLARSNNSATSSVQQLTQAIGHVSAAGSRAATAQAGQAAATAAAAGAARGLSGTLAGLSSALPQVAIGVATVSLAVELGTRAWEAYGEASKTASMKATEAARQRLDAEKQTEQIEAAIFEERRRRQGWQLQMIDELSEKQQRYKDLQSQMRESLNNSFQGRLAFNADDPNTQLRMLRERDWSRDQNAVRAAGADDGSGRTKLVTVQYGKGNLSDADVAQQAFRANRNAGLTTNRLSGDDLLNGQKDLLVVLKTNRDYIEERKKSQEQELQIMRQQFQLGQQHQQSLKGQLATIHEMIAAEQGRLTSAAERFAQMDPGEQARLKEVSLKAKNGGELSLQEAQLLSQSGLGQGQASQAFQRIADKAGFQQVAGNLGEFNQIEQLRFQGKGLQSSVRQAEEASQNQQKEIDGLSRLLQKNYENSELLLKMINEGSAKYDELNSQINRGKTASRDPSMVGVIGR